MKKAIISLVLVLALAGLASATQYSVDFTTAFALNASATKVNVSDFTSVVVSIPANVTKGILITTFARAAGSGSLAAAFYFQVSYDNGTTWADYVDPVTGLEYVAVLTGHGVIATTTVRVANFINLGGITNIRLAKVINNDSGNNLTAVNASISFTY